MKRFLQLAAAIFICGSIVFAQTGNKIELQTERDKQEIIRLNEELSRASEKDRAEVLTQVLDDNFVSFATSNQPRNKARVLRSWATPNTDPLVSYSLSSSDSARHD